MKENTCRLAPGPPSWNRIGVHQRHGQGITKTIIEIPQTSPRTSAYSRLGGVFSWALVALHQLINSPSPPLSCTKPHLKIEEEKTQLSSCYSSKRGCAIRCAINSITGRPLSNDGRDGRFRPLGNSPTSSSSFYCHFISTKLLSFACPLGL